MEIMLGIVILGGIIILAYNLLNKEKADGTHPLDSVTQPVEEKQPAEMYEPIEPVKSALAPALVKAKEVSTKKAPVKVISKQAKKKSNAKTTVT
jgi:hypothetical protein